ncbi:DUF2018 family protein [Campylobacter sp. RM12640]|uniref:DUF2018 family protein n=1 Tax=unclassified Campylobacter TaxID=2593542 RepID=UPI001D7967E3|nr:DUF2018 family protein [Campylobacter sp. RM12640]MBZ7988844.1 DUF2018 family protein [Campylobacter sp. RM12635]MBZ7990985.1 DUF2018 family protein [Campylobacter sp. RM9331]MBZ8005289.1 DUF2018 family protein [Campylobacter sp. RM9332]
MDDFDKLFETTPEEKLIDVLQNAPRGAVQNTVVTHSKEFLALKLLLEKQNIDYTQVEEFIFNNDALLNEMLNDVFIDLTAKILGHEG